MLHRQRNWYQCLTDVADRRFKVHLCSCYRIPAVCPEEMEDKSSFTSQVEAKRPRRYSLCLASELSLSRALPVETTWTASDIVKAGCILTIPPRPLHFEDEGEMRRIYSLIYDVFRCNLSQLFSVNYNCIYVAKSSVKI